MTTIRHRSALVALAFLAAGLSACASDASSPLEPTAKPSVNAVVDSVSRTPTLPWGAVRTPATTPIADVTTATPTLPWGKVSQATSTGSSY